MTGRHFIMSAAHNVGVEPNANGIRTAKLISKLFKNGYVVDVDIHAQVFSGLDLRKINTVGRKKNFVGSESGLQSQLHFVNTDTIESRTKALNIFQHID